nr:U1 small nuclear ribonucleoprotein 70 kDa isoform X2 [Tanacetum cinerariifolium]
MTIDDENSIYVGNLPYEATEATIRAAFDIYGQIIAVK